MKSTSTERLRSLTFHVVQKILNGQKEAFTETCEKSGERSVFRCGYDSGSRWVGVQRVSGSHHIFSRAGTPEIVNLQKVKGQAKPYQVRQLVKLIEKHNLKIKE